LRSDLERRNVEQAPEVVVGSSNVAVPAEGRLVLHRMRVAAFEVTEHQLSLITVTGQDAGVEFNVFIASASIAFTILLALYTTDIPKPDVASWWRGGLIAFTVLALTFLVIWIRKRRLFSDIIAEIKNQKLGH
jgi:hypothetical protein